MLHSLVLHVITVMDNTFLSDHNHATIYIIALSIATTKHCIPPHFKWNLSRKWLLSKIIVPKDTLIRYQKSRSSYASVAFKTGEPYCPVNVGQRQEWLPVSSANEIIFEVRELPIYEQHHGFYSGYLNKSLNAPLHRMGRSLCYKNTLALWRALWLIFCLLDIV